MPEPIISRIPVENLNLNLENPRYPPQVNQLEAITVLAQDQGIKLVNLARDIIDNGFNPSDIPLVAGPDEDGMYTVREGNRRLAALKLLASHDLLTSIGLRKSHIAQYERLYIRAGSNLPTEIICAIVSPEDANHWIQLKHTGENRGIGVVSWDGRATQRFRGLSPALEVVELIEKSNYIDDETRKNLPKIPITNIERLISTPDARKALGVDLKGKDKELVFIAPREEVLQRLAIVVKEVANGDIKVTNLDSRDQRVAYAQRVAGMPLPTPVSGASTSGTSSSDPTPTKPNRTRRNSPDRETVIPSSFRANIQHTRINQIYHELQKLNASKFVNCCAVMLRVFVELSIDHYAQNQNIPMTTPPKQAGGSEKFLTLRQKIHVVANDLENRKICNRHQLQGIRSLSTNSNHVLSVDILNAYVHNMDYSPTPTDLKANWDTIEPFVQALWSV